MILLPHANPQSTGSVLPGIGLENDFLDCSVLRYLNPEIREILMDLEWHCDISSTSMVALRSTSLGARPVICCSRRCAPILSLLQCPLKGILWSPVFCFWSRVSDSVAVSCALIWRQPARERIIRGTAILHVIYT